MLFFLGSLHAQDKVLHVSTNPSSVDLYINQKNPSHASTPDYVSPAFITVPKNDTSVLIHLFKEEYADTTLRISLSSKDTSYIIIAQKQTYQDSILNRQQKDLSHRNRRNLGHILLVASAVPFIAGGIASWISYYQIEKANKSKDKIENSLIHSDPRYQSFKRDFRNSKDKAETANKTATASFIAGAVVLSVGICLSF
ncbi:MAG: hypothetical protein HUK21_03355 [Fibrobacteraceae bacterium]|nr:hypothetical protein [Fibrobacteraceae bacterium]